MHRLRELVTPTHMVVGYGKTVVWHSGNSQFAMTGPGSKLCCIGSADNEPGRSDPFAPPLIGVTGFGL